MCFNPYFPGFFSSTSQPDPPSNPLQKIACQAVVNLTPTSTHIPNQPFVKKFFGHFFIFGFF
jgi:hypothetical protein